MSCELRVLFPVSALLWEVGYYWSGCVHEFLRFLLTWRDVSWTLREQSSSRCSKNLPAAPSLNSTWTRLFTKCSRWREVGVSHNPTFRFCKIVSWLLLLWKPTTLTAQDNRTNQPPFRLMRVSPTVRKTSFSLCASVVLDCWLISSLIIGTVVTGGLSISLRSVQERSPSPFASLAVDSLLVATRCSLYARVLCWIVS